MGNRSGDFGWATIVTGTPVGKGNNRRKEWCEHYRKSDNTCWSNRCSGYICGGSIRCQKYTEDPNKKKNRIGK